MKKTKKKQKPIETIVENEDQMEITEDSIESSSLNASSKTTTLKATKKKKSMQSQPDEDDASEEERWLEAIEAGKDLEEVDDELKKIKPKDPRLMTARQRAMYEKSIGDTNSVSPAQKSSARKSIPTTTIVDGVQANVSSSGELLLALPNFKVKKGKDKVPLTAEDIEKFKEKAQKRKQLADEKREKDKKKTMERLLKKQDSKMVKSIKVRLVKQLVPVISYKNNINGAFLHFPPLYEFPLKSQRAKEPPKLKFCGIPGCKNLKRYSCSKTNVPLCSLECFKKNVESVKQMIF